MEQENKVASAWQSAVSAAYKMAIVKCFGTLEEIIWGIASLILIMTNNWFLFKVKIIWERRINERCEQNETWGFHLQTAKRGQWEVIMSILISLSQFS